MFLVDDVAPKLLALRSFFFKIIVIFFSTLWAKCWSERKPSA